MCVGNVGSSVLVRVFVQPIEKQGKLYVNAWTSMITGVDTALEPRTEDYQGLLPVNFSYDSKLTFTTPRGSVYVVSTNGSALVGRVSNQNLNDVRLPCHPTTTKSPST